MPLERPQSDKNSSWNRGAASPHPVNCRIRHVFRGLTAGALFGLVENLVALFTGTNVPLESLGLTLGVDLLAGALVGSSAALLLRRSTSPRTTFLFFAAATLCLYELDRGLLAVHNRGLVFVLGCLALALLAGVGLVLRLKVLDGLDGPGRTELALAVALLVFDAFLVGSHLLAQELGGQYLSLRSAALQAGLGILTLLALRVATRLVARIPIRSRAGTPAEVTLLTLGLTAALSLLAWAVRLPRERPVSHANAAPVLSRGPSILLVSLDTLRADHVSCYGYERRTTPRLDAFSRDAVLYRNAFSPASWTLPAHVSMLSGEPPRRHGSDLNKHGLSPIHAETVLLAELLAKAGYRTAAVVANSTILRSSMGFDRGFDLYDARLRQLFGFQPASHRLLAWLAPLESDRLLKHTRDASEILEEALAWIDGRTGAPFFLFVNLMEPHPPWAPPPAFQDAFPGRSARLRLPSREIRDRMTGGEERLDERVRRNALALYDGAIASMDDALGRFLDGLRKRHLYDEALVIVTADHGEFFGEHGRWGHGYGPYDPVYRVPLLVKYPGASEHGERDEWVDTIRIFSTILKTAGLRGPAGVDIDPLDGSRRPTAIEQQRDPWRAPSRFTRPYEVLRDDPWKLVAYENSSELYDLRRDPGEEHDLSRDEPARVEEMRRQLATWAASVRPLPEASGDRKRDKELMRGLRALGYLR
jgi:arylsulfatase A-like enzyme